MAYREDNLVADAIELDADQLVVLDKVAVLVGDRYVDMSAANRQCG